MDYTSLEELKAHFGKDWATDDDLLLFADMINAWLLSNQIPTKDQVQPKDWLIIQKAIAFLARAAKEGSLFTDSSNIRSKTVSADTGTSISTSYAAYGSTKSRWIKVAENLLTQWLNVSRVSAIYKIN